MKHLGPAACFLLTPLVTALPCSAVSGEPQSPPVTAHVPVEELRLANGITLLLVPQPESTTVAVGWVVRAGSADDASDQTGLSHLLEHMMFKGSRSIGSRNLEQELDALATVDRLWSKREALRIKFDAASGKRRQKLNQKLETVTADLRTAQDQASSLASLGQYSFLYSQQGGTGLNANTYRDMSLYYLTLPGEKLELWFWLESDRLLNPVFREFYKEVQVVHEERRQRIESTPTGPPDQDLRALFWNDHAYSWDPMGRSEDLDRLSRQDALDFFTEHYRTDEMTFALVGGFDPVQVESWAERYLARLPAPAQPRSPKIRQKPPSRIQEERLRATCNCPPQVKIMYPSARFSEPDAYALQLLSAVLNGRTGRLYRSLVLDQQIAFSAYTQQISWRQAGEFSFRAESKGAVDPEDLIRAWDQQLDLLHTRPPTVGEIRRAVNRSTADAFRSLKDPTDLMKQLLIYQGLGEWRYINQWSESMRGLNSDDLVRVAVKYLRPDRRVAAIYRRPQAQASQ